MSVVSILGQRTYGSAITSRVVVVVVVVVVTSPATTAEEETDNYSVGPKVRISNLVEVLFLDAKSETLEVIVLSDDFGLDNVNAHSRDFCSCLFRRDVNGDVTNIQIGGQVGAAP